MPQSPIPVPDMGRPSSIRRPFADHSRKATGISAFVFFAAVLVVGGWGLSGLQDSEEESTEAQLIYAGGAPQQASGVATVSERNRTSAGDDAVVGEFGDPVAELYEEENEGGWSEGALERTPS